jgi:hypothetical protein
MTTTTHDENGRELRLRLEMSKEIDASTGCWIWKGAKTKGGYGELRVEGRVKYTHRLSATLYFGFDESSGLYVLHRCDVRACFNPHHLFVGTQAENMQDASAKGRLGRGKLKPQQVAQIKRLLMDDWTHADLARRYGVSAATISQIARRQIWKNIEPAPPFAVVSMSAKE